MKLLQLRVMVNFFFVYAGVCVGLRKNRIGEEGNQSKIETAKIVFK